MSGQTYRDAVDTNLWLGFWFDFHNSIHESWMTAAFSEKQRALLPTAGSSQLQWRLSYPLLCKTLEIPMFEPGGSVEQRHFWRYFLPYIKDKHNPVIKSVARIACGKKITPAEAKLHGCGHSQFSLEIATAETLQLNKRLADVNFPEEETAGLWLLYCALSDDFPESWRRFSLRLDKALVENLESLARPESLPFATRRNVTRVWRMLSNTTPRNTDRHTPKETLEKAA